MSHTSGTTGKPLQFYENFETKIKEWAFICHQWARVGYKPGNGRIELRGRVNEKEPVYYDPLANVLRFSPLIKDKRTTEMYLKKMRDFKSDFLHGYPGAIALLARSIKEYKLMVPFKLKAILTASEKLYEWERETIEDVFQCKTFDFYGQSEKSVLAAQCEKSKRYHCIPQYGITEFEPKTNEIIATAFLNTVNPFIRYRLTDTVQDPRYDSCKDCGRDYYPTFDEIEGRSEDFISTSDGTLITPAVITHPFKDLKTIKNTQIIQKDLDKIIIRIVSITEADSISLQGEISNLVRELNKIIGFKTKIIAEIVKEIDLNSSGKFKWIINELKSF
jgi:phenylacetate-coenzyme A ligase PaaK-like adenylate-forming protein